MTTRDLDGRRIIVTGATDGIGRVTAERLIERGASIGIVGRNADKVSETVHTLQGRAPHRVRVEGFVADLSRQADVRRVADEIAQRFPQLDVLVNNAGAIFDTRAETSEGIERTLALNHLAYALLAARLLPVLRHGGAPRIVCVASRAHRRATFELDDLQFERRAFSGWRAYCESKLYNVMHAMALARRLTPAGITVNALHPGFVASRFGSSAGFAGRLLRLIMPFTAVSVEEGARTPVFLAGDPSVAGATGGYYVRSATAIASATARDESAQEVLWQATTRLIGESPAPI